MAQAADAIVVGAGLSGLKAASDLVARGKSVVVVEARDRVGGRTMGGELCGRAIDHGAQWVGPRHTRLLAEAKSFGLQTYPQYAQGKTILSLEGTRSEFAGAVPKMPVLALIELLLLQRRWNRDMKTLPYGAPWEAAKAKEWDSQTLESWIVKNLRTKSARAFARLVPKGSYAASATEVSYLWMMEMLRTNEGLEQLMNVEGGITDAKFKGGAHQIAQRMAGALGESVVLSVPVRTIAQDERSVTVTTDKGVFEAGYAIVAVPPGICSRIDFGDALSPQRQALSQRLPQTGIIKIHIAYEEPFWRGKGYTGQIVSSELPLGIVMEDVQEVGPPMLIGFAEGAQAQKLSAMGGNERRAKVMDCLVGLFGREANDAIGYAEKDWLADEWARGYVGSMGPGVLTQYGEALRAPCGRVHWASTETALLWCGSMEGALESGERAASEVIARLG